MPSIEDADPNDKTLTAKEALEMALEEIARNNRHYGATSEELRALKRSTKESNEESSATIARLQGDRALFVQLVIALAPLLAQSVLQALGSQDARTLGEILGKFGSSWLFNYNLKKGLNEPEKWTAQCVKLGQADAKKNLGETTWRQEMEMVKVVDTVLDLFVKLTDKDRAAILELMKTHNSSWLADFTQHLTAAPQADRAV